MDSCLTTRVRLARNFADIPFRAMMTMPQAAECARRTLDAMKEMTRPARFIEMSALEQRERQQMVEKRLISAELAADDAAGVLMTTDERVSVMICEEDHLRIQAIEPGMCLRQAAQAAFEVDDALERAYKMAYDTRLGYLTACPTNVGTGMRASVMLHLPMLTALKQMGKVAQLAGKLGLTLRGMYGEGSEALGCLYQLSNQVTLGRSEDEILDAVQSVGKQVMQMERTLMDSMLTRSRVMVQDQCWRALGIMKNARRMPLKEFMQHYSSMRMGALAGVLPLSAEGLDALLVGAQPAHVSAPEETDTAKTVVSGEDIARADYVRAHLTEGV